MTMIDTSQRVNSDVEKILGAKGKIYKDLANYMDVTKRKEGVEDMLLARSSVETVEASFIEQVKHDNHAS